MELNRELIVKAWECCHTQGKDCLSCPYENDHSNCVYLDKNALSLIKELTEENERLEASIKILVANNADLETELAITYDLLEETKTDTVRKMQTEIEARCIKGGIYPAFVKRTIDHVVEEMLGGDNADKED